MKRHTVAALTLMILSSPLWAKRSPAWVRGPDPAYPESKYAVGVGVGNDLESARSNARAEIARSFQSRVQQTLTDVQTESSTSVDTRRSPALGTQESEMTTRVSTDALLEGVIIKETYYDRKEKKHYALAVLDKVDARRALSAQIADKEGVISRARAEAGRADSAVESARALARGLAAARERDALGARRRVLDPAGMADFPAGPTAAVEADLRQTLSRVPVQISVDGPEGANLEQEVAAAVTGLGLQVVPSSDKPEGLRLTVKLSVHPFDRGNPQWYFYQWNGSVDLTDLATGKTVGSATRQAQDGHLVPQTAEVKARTAGASAMALEAGRLLSQHVLGE